MWRPKKVCNECKSFKGRHMDWYNSDTNSDVCFFHITRPINSILTRSPGRSHRLGAQSTRLPFPAPPSDTSPKARCYLCVWPAGSRLEVPVTPPPWIQVICYTGSQNSGTFYFLGYQFIMKGFNSETARWERCPGQGMWEKVQSFHALWTLHPPSASMCPSTQKHSKPSPLGVLWHLYYIGMMD